jgi:exonuclease III
LEIENSFMSKHLKLFNYEYPENPAAKGIAIVLNREITNVDGVKVHYLIPGKVLLAVVPWHGDKTLTVLGLYTPTESDAEKISFWNRLTELWMTTDLPVPDAVGGDLNVVPEAIDRLPLHTDSEAVVSAYLRFIRTLDLKDGWRISNPDKKDYTHNSTRGTLSRIERIVVSPTLLKNCRGWDISDAAGGLTNHRMVLVTISAPNAPYIGKGRWTMPQFLLHDKDLLRYAVDEGCKLEDSMTETRSDTSNAQTRFKKYKDQIIEFAKERAKVLLEQQKRRSVSSRMSEKH